MRLYVGGLPYQTTEQDLIELFQPTTSEPISFATVITDRETGRSKGFGFIEIGNDEEARYAIERLNGTTLGNRTITVNEAKERQPRSDSRRDGGYRQRGGGGYNDRY